MRITHIYLYFTLIGLVLLGACKTKKGSQSEILRFDGKNWVKGEANLDTTSAQVFEDSLGIDEDTLVMIDTLTPELSITKEVYRVAVILPFMEDSVRQAWSAASKKNFEKFQTSTESEMAISFMEGMIMALKDMSLKSKFSFEFFDDNHSSSSMATILAKIEKDSFDVLIGPSLKSNLVSVSKFAKDNEIIHLSPFSPSRSISSGYGKYYMIEPSLTQHIMTMVNYGLDSIENVNIKFLYHESASGDESAQALANYMDSFNDSLDMEEKIAYSNIELGSKDFLSSFKLNKYLDEEAHNLVIVNSFNEALIHQFLRQLNGSSKNYDLTVFGMPGWENIETVRLDYINNGEIHFTTSFCIDEELDAVLAFQNRYKNKYEGKPGENVYLGYEVASIFFPLIDTFGLSFNDQLLYTDFTPKVRSYNFTEVWNENEELDRIENTSLRIYKIQDFERVPVK